MSWDADMVARAKREKHWLYKVVLEGKYLGTGSIDGCGTMNEAHASALITLLTARPQDIAPAIELLNHIAKVGG